MPELTDAERQHIAEFRQEHIGRLFLNANRDFSLRAIEKLTAYGHNHLSLSHTALLANLDVEGTRVTTLAERMEISKQAISSLVVELEEKGYIHRETDPQDKRAILLTYTEAGWQFLVDANKVKHEIEAEYTAILGEENLQLLRQLLSRLIKG